MYKTRDWLGGMLLKTYAKRRRMTRNPIAHQEQQLLTLVERITLAGHPGVDVRVRVRLMFAPAQQPGRSAHWHQP